MTRLLDAEGAPLPERILARLGSPSFRSPELATILALDPEGDTLVLGGTGGVDLWRRKDGARLARWSPEEGELRLAAYAPRGDRVVVVDDTGVAVFAAAGEPVVASWPLKRAVAAALSPDGGLLAAVDARGKVQLLDVGSGAKRATFAGPARPKRCAFTGDGRRLAVATERELRVFEVAGGAETHRFRAGDAYLLGIAAAPEGRRLAAAGTDGRIWIWSLDGRPAASIPHAAAPAQTWARCVAFSPAGDLVASGGDDGHVRLWDARGELVRDLDLAGTRPFALCFDPQGKTLTAAAGRTLFTWDLAAGEPLGDHARHGEPPTTLAWTPGGDGLLTQGDARLVRLWDLVTGGIARGFAGTGEVTGSALAGDRVVLFDRGPMALSVRSLATGAELLAAPEPDGFSPFAASPSLAAIKLYSPLVRVRDLVTGAVACDLPVGEAPARDLAFDALGCVLVTQAHDERPRVWDMPRGQERAKLRWPRSGDGADGRCFAIAPGGARLVTGHPSGALRVWDTKTGAALRTLAGAGDRAERLAISPAGDRVAAALEGGEVRVEGVDEGAPGLVLEGGHDGEVTALSFSPDGDRLATAGADGLVLVWSLRPQAG